MEQDSLWKRWVIGGLGALGLGNLAVVVLSPNPYLRWGAVAILILLIFVALAYLGWLAWKRKQSRQRFAGDLQQQSAAAPRSISDPNKRAKLDDLRRRFDDGLHIYEKSGKDLYKLPWYLVVGEPGSGKSEAVRHCNVGFPPGLQDEMQGVGGTVNMNWWFTNYAVLLDTAGRLMFEETAPGETTEWREFLKLLRKNRPRCPVNGLLLVLPVDSLIKDSADKIAQKAGKIAQQLDTIQRALDIRFPVFVLVTKCDLLTGFREFFDGIEDPQLQHQILGWSNPDPLDAAFRADLVADHLQKVIDRLRRRRLTLLRDPAPVMGLQGRRVDEVDALFALPQSIALIAPRLRRYLETIFVAGEWSSKPLFLRGIYFTSSLREGSALDEALASALGVAAEELPEGRVWERDRAFFLRDLFMEKVFRERGLVTRATNTRQMLRNRRLALYGCTTGALVLLLLFSWIGWRSLKQSVRSESAFWQIAATNGWDQARWNPVVRPGVQDPFVFTYAGGDFFPTGQTNSTIVTYHHDLRSLASRPLAVSWVFKPITWLRPSRDLNRPLAQNVLFDRSVLDPLVQQSRLKLLNQAGAAEPPAYDPARADHHATVLEALLRLEADQKFNRSTFDGTNAAQRAESLLGAFLGFLTETTAPVDTNLVEVFRWTYGEGKGKGQWPPKALLGGDSLATNSAIAAGLDQFFRYTDMGATNTADNLKLVNEIRERLRRLARAETNFHGAVESSKGADASAFADLTAAKAQLDLGLAQAKKQPGLFQGSAFSLEAGYTNLLAESRASTNRFTRLYAAMAGGTDPVATGLFKEVRERLGGYKSRTQQEIESSYQQTRYLLELDRCYLADYDKQNRAYVHRWLLYQRATDLGQASQIRIEDWLGKAWEPFEGIRTNVESLKANVAAYKGCFEKELFQTCNTLASEAERILQQESVQKYAAFVSARLKELTTAPATRYDVAFLQTCTNFYAKLDRDLDPDATRRTGQPEEAFATLRAQAALGRTNLIQAYVRKREADLRSSLGWPVMLDEKLDSMDRDKLRAAQQLIGRVAAQELPVLAYFPQGPVKGLRDRMRVLEGVMRGLVDADGNPMGCTISLMPQQDDLKKTSLRRVQLVLNNKPGTVQDLTRGGDTELAKGALDHLLEVRLFESGEDKPAVQKELFLWGPLALIAQAGKTDDVKRTAEGRAWEVAYRVGEGKDAARLNLKITLEQPLPELSAWPRQ